MLIALLSLDTAIGQTGSQVGQLLLSSGSIDIRGWHVDERHLEISLDFGPLQFLDTVTGQFTQSVTTNSLTADEISFFGIDTSDPDAPRSEYVVSPNNVYVAYSV
jgi:hypothetical protein